MKPMIEHTPRKPVRGRTLLATTLAALSLATIATLPHTVTAQEADINRILSGEPAKVEAGNDANSGATQGQDTAVPVVPVAPEAVGSGTPSAAAPSPSPSGTGTDGDVNQERWIKSDNAIEHLHVISARPLPGENCKQVIFDARPYLKTRHEPSDGTQLAMELESVCLIALRNGDEKRTLVVRLGEAFETLAIVPNPQLFTGMIIAPGQQVTIAIRSLPVNRLDIPLEVVWEAELDTPAPKTGKATLTFSRSS